MTLLNYFFLFFFLFFVFSLGLNLGLHGAISFYGWHQTNGKDYSRGIILQHDVNQWSHPQLYPTQENGGREDIVGQIKSDRLDGKIIADEQEQLIQLIADPMQYDSLILKAVTLHQYVIPPTLKAVLIAAEKRYNSAKVGPMESYIQMNGRLPVALLTCNRAKNLEQTLDSLLAVRGIEKTDVIILQDGNMEAIKNVGEKYGIELIQNVQTVRLRGNVVTGAAKIAQHYKFSLSTVFRVRPSAPACIIVEDDLLFSPDFLDYFKTIAPLIEKDPTVFIASAWNDNGFSGKVRDVYGLRRTEFFPGLGWLLSRQLYIEELEPIWPSEHWDHWLRSDSISKGREIIYPQVPRSFHNGVIGTFMNVDTHNKYFRDIAFNRKNNVSWSSMAYLQVVEDVYEQRIRELINRCIHVLSVQDLLSESGLGKVHCVWINVNPEPLLNGFQEFEPISEFFRLWHEHKRGAHRGVHEFYWKNRYVVILNIFDSVGRRAIGRFTNYRSLMPPSARVIARNEFVLH